ncbi:hypothetical protein AMTR_s00128p00066760 [Amborella trichopoda]|uniref:Uncharacterized protein n=1 Tax=Amborella trichopoda TaxID=13333 RepID=W1NLT8_AMBTC|nr:hypothetical protein AMTR_s00128p00066760 [Amborella trichopoda]
MTPHLGMASVAQEVGDVAIELVHESSPTPSSPRRTSSDMAPCAGESTPLELGETIEAESVIVDDDPIIVQGEDLGVAGASKPHEEAAEGVGLALLEKRSPSSLRSLE